MASPENPVRPARHRLVLVAGGALLALILVVMGLLFIEEDSDSQVVEAPVVDALGERPFFLDEPPRTEDAKRARPDRSSRRSRPDVRHRSESPFPRSDSAEADQRKRLLQAVRAASATRSFSSGLEAGGRAERRGSGGSRRIREQLESLRERLVDGMHSLEGVANGGALGQEGGEIGLALVRSSGLETAPFALQRDAGIAQDGARVSAGTVLPVVAVTRVTTDSPGVAIAMLTRDVFDAGLRQVVLPAGSMLLTSHEQAVSVGERRLAFAWDRIEVPRGTGGLAAGVYQLPGLPGGGWGGEGGVRAHVENHWWQIFGSAAILSLIDIGSQLSSNDGNLLTNNREEVASAAASSALSEVITQLLRRNMSISPTLSLEPGTRFHVVVSRDLHIPRELFRKVS